MVESTALEMRRTFTGTVGSNPTLSAIILSQANEIGLTGPENPKPAGIRTQGVMWFAKVNDTVNHCQAARRAAVPFEKFVQVT